MSFGLNRPETIAMGECGIDKARLSNTPLPKLQLPSDEATQALILEACEAARAGDIRTAQKTMRSAVNSGAVGAPLQRDVLKYWSAGVFDLPGLSGADHLASKPKPAPVDPKKLETTFDRQVRECMKERGMSSKQAVEFIEGGGLDMERMHEQMAAENPMSKLLDQMKEQGPPQWFIDAVNEKEAAAAAAAAGGEAAAPAAA